MGRTSYEVPHRVWRSLAESGDVASSAARLVRSAIADPAAGVSVALPDAGGRLRVVWRDGWAQTSDRRRSRLRRTAFETGTIRRMSQGGVAIVMLPLVSADASIGVLEIAAAAEAQDGAGETLEAIAEQLAITLRNLFAHAARRPELEVLEGAATLGHDLLSAAGSEDLVRATARFIFERSHAPVTSWYATDEGDRHRLASIHGMGLRGRRVLHSSMRSLPVWGDMTDEGRDGMLRRFADAAGTDRVEVLGGREILIMAADPNGSLGGSLRAVRSLLDEVLRLRAATVQAQQRDDQLDLGIAWIAHELRGPLLGVKAVLENLVQDDGASPMEPEVLRASVRELEQLAGTTEGILGWAVGARPLRRRSIDLGRLIDQTVASCILETGNDSVRVLASSRVIVKVDPAHLRVAIANLVRNALTFSRSGEKVEVRLEPDNGWATIEVRDEGPGISASERETIFDPFVRGKTSSPRRSGSGLGLFIARRVVEAHGGQIWMKSHGRGASFIIRLRADERVSRRCAS